MASLCVQDDDDCDVSPPCHETDDVFSMEPIQHPYKVRYQSRPGAEPIVHCYEQPHLYRYLQTFDRDPHTNLGYTQDQIAKIRAATRRAGLVPEDLEAAEEEDLRARLHALEEPVDEVQTARNIIEETLTTLAFFLQEPDREVNRYRPGALNTGITRLLQNLETWSFQYERNFNIRSLTEMLSSLSHNLRLIRRIVLQERDPSKMVEIQRVIHGLLQQSLQSVATFLQILLTGDHIQQIRPLLITLPNDLQNIVEQLGDILVDAPRGYRRPGLFFSQNAEQRQLYALAAQEMAKDLF